MHVLFSPWFFVWEGASGYSNVSALRGGGGRAFWKFKPIADDGSNDACMVHTPVHTFSWLVLLMQAHLLLMCTSAYLNTNRKTRYDRTTGTYMYAYIMIFLTSFFFAIFSILSSFFSRGGVLSYLFFVLLGRAFCAATFAPQSRLSLTCGFLFPRPRRAQPHIGFSSPPPTEVTGVASSR